MNCGWLKITDSTMDMHKFIACLHYGSEAYHTAHALLHMRFLFSSAFMCMSGAVKEGHYDNPAPRLDHGSPCCAQLSRVRPSCCDILTQYSKIFASTTLLSVCSMLHWEFHLQSFMPNSLVSVRGHCHFVYFSFNLACFLGFAILLRPFPSWHSIFSYLSWSLVPPFFFLLLVSILCSPHQVPVHFCRNCF